VCVPVVLAGIELNLRGHTRQDIEPSPRPLVLCPYPEFPDDIVWQGQVPQVTDFIGKFLFYNDIANELCPDLFDLDRNNNEIAPSKILHQNELEMRACSVFLNKLLFDSKSTFENHVKLRKD